MNLSNLSDFRMPGRLSHSASQTLFPLLRPDDQKTNLIKRRLSGSMRRCKKKRCQAARRLHGDALNFKECFSEASAFCKIADSSRLKVQAAESLGDGVQIGGPIQAPNKVTLSCAHANQKRLGKHKASCFSSSSDVSVCNRSASRTEITRNGACRSRHESCKLCNFNKSVCISCKSQLAAT